MKLNEFHRVNIARQHEAFAPPHSLTALVVCCQEEVDAKFQQAVLTQATPGPRDLKVIYSPLHGVGATAVIPVLAADGFQEVEVFGPHAQPDGDFPNVPGHVSNPENPKAASVS